MFVPASDDSPGEVLDGGIVLILANTIVCMDVNVRVVARSMVLQVVVEKTNGAIGSLASIVCFINEVVVLDTFWLTTDTKIWHLQDVRK